MDETVGMKLYTIITDSIEWDGIIGLVSTLNILTDTGRGTAMPGVFTHKELARLLQLKNHRRLRPEVRHMLRSLAFIHGLSGDRS